jgi:hypothetical protein
MKKIIFVTQTLGYKSACGIGLIGKLLAETLVKSKKYNFEILYTDNICDVENEIIKNKPDVVIFNYHAGSSRLAEDIEIRKKYNNIKYILLHHEMNQAMVDNFSPEKFFGFEYLICGDNTLNTNDGIFTTNRLMPPYSPSQYVDSQIPIIGFQGFGFKHKGIHKIANKVQEEFDEAIIRLHIPFSYFGDPYGVEAKERVQEVKNIITKPGIKVEASYDLKTTQEIVEFLSKNTINCYFYDLLSDRGLASSTDYALAARRPIAVTKSHQLRNFIGLKPSICIEDNSLRDIISFGLKPLENLYNAYKEEVVISEYEKIIDNILWRK